MKALILSAGLGTRLLPYTNHISKCAFPLLNLPLFAYSLYHAKRLGVQEVFFNLHHQSLKTKETILELEPNAEFSYEKEILSSGGGILKLEKHFKDEEVFLVCNGDSPIFLTEDFDLRDFVKAHKQSGSLATLLTTQMPHHPGIQGLSVKDSHIVDFYKNPIEKKEHFVGYFLLSSSIFKYIKKEKAHIFKDVLAPAIAQGEKVMSYYKKDLLWHETGNEVDFIKASKDLIDHIKNETPYALQIKNILNFFNPHLEFSPTYIKDKSSQLDLKGSGFVILGKKASFSGECNSFCVIGDHQKITGKLESSAVVASKQTNLNISNQIHLELN